MEGYENIQSMQGYETTPPNPAVMMGMGAIYLVIIVLFVVSGWKIYAKAGKPGWAAIIPIYNLYILLQIIGRPGWWLLLYLIPFVNIIISLITAIDLAKAFGKSTAFGVLGLWLFSIIGYPILAFGKSTYQSSPSKPSTPTPSAPKA